MDNESLSFFVKRVDGHDDLMKACSVRAQAYGRKNPGYLEALKHPDSIDHSPLTTNYICIDKVSKAPVGAMRLQEAAADRLLEIEKYVSLPTVIRASNHCEITRLSAINQADPQVRPLLWKVGRLHTLHRNARWLVLGVRRPGLFRAYIEMGAQEVADPTALPYAGNQVHRILAIDLELAASDWRERGHPLLDFMLSPPPPEVHLDFSVGGLKSEVQHPQA